MTERASTATAPLCGCSRPLVEELRSCVRCGHELAASEFELSPRAQRMARLIAEYAIEMLDERERTNGGRQGARTDLIQRKQLELGDDS
jgi:hypothetical protein